jgi:dienelactone hydrolase
MTHVEKFPLLKALSALLAATALVALLGVVVPARAASPHDDRFVTTTLPNTPAGRQLHWLVEATTRLPLSEAELRAHFAQAFLAMPGYSPARTNAYLSTLFDTSGMHFKGVVATRRKALVAVVAGRAPHELVLTLAIDRAGFIAFPTGITTPAILAPASLPSPSGRSPIGTDTMQLIDRSRGGRRVMLTRWYPATAAARSRPLAIYASPRLRTVIGLPQVHVHAHTGARALPGPLPVVLFSPGGNTPRVIYQALAEDLASHGYLVISVDHTGEAPVQFPNGHIELPSWWTNPPKPTTSFDTGLRMAQHTRLRDLQLILSRLSNMPKGPVPDLTRIASIGHSLGGSTSAALMRVDSSIRAGIDLDGSIFGAAANGGVSRPFLILGEGGLDPSTRSLLEHSTGPRLGINIAGLQHMSFSDGPALWPAALNIGKWKASAKDIIIQRVYVRAFLDRYLLGLPSQLLDGRSLRYPRVTFSYRGV